MARTPVPITDVAADVAVTPPGGTALDATNGHFVSWPGDQDRLLFIITNSATAAQNFTFKGGDLDLTLGLGAGTDLVVSVPAGATRWLRLSSRRFQQSGIQGDPNYGGALMIDLQAGTTGTITIVRLAPGP